MYYTTQYPHCGNEVKTVQWLILWVKLAKPWGPDIWQNIILDVSVKMFLNKVNI